LQLAIQGEDRSREVCGNGRPARARVWICIVCSAQGSRRATLQRRPCRPQGAWQDRELRVEVVQLQPRPFALLVDPVVAMVDEQPGTAGCADRAAVTSPLLARARVKNVAIVERSNDIGSTWMNHRAWFLPLVAAGAILASPAAASARIAGALAGSYRVTLASVDLVQAGASAAGAADDSGTWTLTFAGRRWALRQEHAPDQNALDRGVVAFAGNRVGFTLLTSDGAPHRVFLGTFSWKVSGGTLRLGLLADQFPTNVLTVLTARLWKRVR